MRRSLVIAVFALSAALAGAPPTAAAPAAIVNFFACAFGGGSVVPAATPVTVWFGMSTDTLGQMSSFLKAATVTGSIDGSSIVNANSYFGVPTQDAGSKTWVVRWTDPTGLPIAAGSSMTITLDVVVSHAVVLGKAVDSRRAGLVPAGSLFGGPITCTIGAS